MEVKYFIASVIVNFLCIAVNMAVIVDLYLHLVVWMQHHTKIKV